MRTAILKSDGLFVKAIGGQVKPEIVNFCEILTKRCMSRSAAEAEMMLYPEGGSIPFRFLVLDKERFYLIQFS